MNYFKDENGFTLVELSVALIITSIITLTAGIIVVSATRDLNRSNRQINLQQDLSLADEILTNAIRGANSDSTRIYSDHTTTEEVISGNCLKIKSSSMYYKNGSDLVIQNESGATQRLLINCVDTLDFYWNSSADSQKCINFRIALQENGYSLATNKKIYFRN